MEDCASFKVLPYKVNEKSTVIRHLFLKMHLTREKCPQKPEYQTLFIVGVPEFCDQTILKHAFRTCGKIKSIFFHKEPTPIEPELLSSKYFVSKPVKGFKVAYIVFAHISALENALSLKCTKSKPLILSTQGAPVRDIVNRWCENYNKNIVDTKELQSEIDTYMTDYDKMSAKQIQVEKNAVDNKDEDGWTTVTKKGRNPGFARKEATKNNILKREAKKKMKKTLKNFYRFQIKETKINQLIDLRTKFDNDKSKIELLKQSRKFRPF